MNNMNDLWSQLTAAYTGNGFPQSAPAQNFGGLLGFGGMRNFMPMQGGNQQYGSPMQGGFPQYGGNSRSAQMMNNYMGGLLSRRTPYMPPRVGKPAAAAPMGAPSMGGVNIDPQGFVQESRG